MSESEDPYRAAGKPFDEAPAEPRPPNPPPPNRDYGIRIITSNKYEQPNDGGQTPHRILWFTSDGEDHEVPTFAELVRLLARRAFTLFAVLDLTAPEEGLSLYPIERLHYVYEWRRSHRTRP